MFPTPIEKKGNQTTSEFGHPEVEAQAKKPLRSAAAVNATRWEIWRRFEATGLIVEMGTGGRTKYNRRQRNLPKTHWLDAVCVGQSTPGELKLDGVQKTRHSLKGRIGQGGATLKIETHNGSILLNPDIPI